MIFWFIGSMAGFKNSMLCNDLKFAEHFAKYSIFSYHSVFDENKQLV